MFATKFDPGAPTNFAAKPPPGLAQTSTTEDLAPGLTQVQTLHGITFLIALPVFFAPSTVFSSTFFAPDVVFSPTVSAVLAVLLIDPLTDLSPGSLSDEARKQNSPR